MNERLLKFWVLDRGMTVHGYDCNIFEQHAASSSGLASEASWSCGTKSKQDGGY